MPRLLWLLLSLITVGALCAAPVSVHVRKAPGKWEKLAVRQGKGKVSCSLPAAASPALLVVNKPAWMVLEDTVAPKATGLKINGKEMPAGHPDIGSLANADLEFLLTFQDQANPLDPKSLQAALSDGGAVSEVTVLAGGPPRKDMRVRLRLPRPGPGHHVLQVSLSDCAPSANRLVCAYRFFVFGAAISADQQEVRLCSQGKTFRFRPEAQATVSVGKGPAAYLTSRVAGQHLYISRIAGVEVLAETPTMTRVRVSGVPGKTDRDQDGEKLARLEYDLEVRADWPCLLVTGRTVNLGPADNLYCWWGWLPGEYYVTPAGKAAWSDQYRGVGKVGWVYLAPSSPGQEGLGWIGPGVFGESRFRTMLLYTDPRDVATPALGSVEIRFALMAAEDAPQVASMAQRLEELGVWK